MNIAERQSPILSTCADGVLRLSMNRPLARNALSGALIEALSGAFAMAAADENLHVVILAAEGRTFCAGHDLKEMRAARADPDRGRDRFAALFRQCSALMLAIVNLPKPVIAEVGGVATAAGCQLVASCDLAVASQDASFATPGVDIGLFCSTPMVALSRNMARKPAMEMLLTGGVIGAGQARELGLVNRVVPVESLQSETMALARKIAAKPKATLRIGKQAFYRQIEMPLAAAYDYASQVMTDNMLGPEAEEGIQAFLEKRDAKWPQ